MRRRRSRLQVSLFPFLAVLLCVLGTLVLLLLVLDQKARQNAAEEAARLAQAARVAQAAQAAQQGSAEIEQERALLQQRLQALEQDRDQLATKARDLRHEQETRARQLERQKAELTALRRAVEAEQQRVAADQEAGVKAADSARAVEQQKTLVHAGLAQLQERIRLMEELVQRMKQTDARARPPVYSLVPYKGRQGTSRLPVYVECAAGQAVFRPGDERLSNEEVRQSERLAGMVRERSARLTAVDGATNPYILLLVRPSGISTYYSVLKALRGSGIEVGYEFVDEELALDFNASTPETGTPIAGASQPRSAFAPAPARPAHRPPAGDSPWTAPPRDILLSPPASSRPGSFGAIEKSAPANSAADSKPISPGGRGQPAPSAPRAKAETAANANPLEQRRQDTAPTFIKPILADPARPTPRQPGTERKAVGESTPPTLPPDPNARAETDPPPAARVPSATGDEKSTDRPRGRRPKTGVTRSVSTEWIIVIECAATGVTVQGHPPLETAKLAGGRADNPLLKLIRDQIEQRRKKTPDAQPKLKYLIHADGLRAYYLASGALQSLKLPATWEAVEEKEAQEGGPSREP